MSSPKNNVMFIIKTQGLTFFKSQSKKSTNKEEIEGYIL